MQLFIDNLANNEETLDYRREEVERNIREAIEFHIEGLREEGYPVPNDYWIGSVPPRGSGWVTIKVYETLEIERSYFVPTRYREVVLTRSKSRRDF